ncbi:hypothetical protein Afil01_27940 [Actinorhabdospora filicis]|uniref:VCBS repeat protein n=1 Tax=Actinorhabdospora filicis TaxID=1785913 RepID=A0A9W6SLH6_9ACTN|nr:VCBS repeat-containing protein [Actinorhabdospora filicis]GLZ77987.1 hypothetical protein Afil01_27940 [Actinorhabdospora filicis]
MQSIRHRILAGAALALAIFAGPAAVLADPAPAQADIITETAVQTDVEVGSSWNTQWFTYSGDVLQDCKGYTYRETFRIEWDADIRLDGVYVRKVTIKMWNEYKGTPTLGVGRYRIWGSGDPWVEESYRSFDTDNEWEEWSPHKPNENGINRFFPWASSDIVAFGFGITDPCVEVDGANRMINLQFQLKRHVTMSSIPTGTIADVNLDGKNDILTRFANGELWLYPGNGSNGFAASYKVGHGFNGASSISVGDTNGDGKPDLITTAADGGDLRIYNHSGNPGSPYGSSIVVGSDWDTMTAVNVGDVNLDGKLDLIGRDTNGNLRAYPGNNANHFGDAYTIGTYWGAMKEINVADVDRDGRADLIGMTQTGDAYLYSHNGNNANPYTGNGRLIGTSWSGMTAVLFGDFNGDGRPDIVTRDGGALILYSHTGTGTPYTRGAQIGRGWANMTDID